MYWETAHTVPGQPQYVLDWARQWQLAEKIVYSRTLDKPRSARTRIEREFDPDAVRSALRRPPPVSLKPAARQEPDRVPAPYPQDQVTHWAERYPSVAGDGALRRRLRPVVRARGYLTRDEFLEICRWKSPRSKPWRAGNDDFTVRTVTRAAFGTKDESLKIDLLRTLKGVEWPTASTLLHFCDRRPYPILDFRARWSWDAARHRVTRWSSGSPI